MWHSSTAVWWIRCDSMWSLCQMWNCQCNMGNVVKQPSFTDAESAVSFSNFKETMAHKSFCWTHLCCCDWQPTGARTHGVQWGACHVRGCVTADNVEIVTCSIYWDEGGVFFRAGMVSHSQRAPYGGSKRGGPGLAWLYSSQHTTWPLTPANTSKCCHNCQTLNRR